MSISQPRSFAKSLWAIFLVSWLVYAIATIIVISRLEPTGDEPHYLLLTYSLLADHDLDLANNYKAKDYERFYREEARTPPGSLDYIGLEKHAFDYKQDGRLYLIHNIALPLLIAPAYALGGRLVASLLMSLLTAFLAMQMHLWCMAHTNSQRATLLAWTPLAFSLPLLAFASQIYPEVPAALIIISTLRLILTKNPLKTRHLFLWSLLCSLLPWFHVKYFIAAAAILVVGIVARLGDMRGIGRILGVAGPLSLSTILLAVFFASIYGNPSPLAPYNAPVAGFDLGTLPSGLLGLWLDQEFGLLPYSPIYIFAFVGIASLFQDRKYRLLLAIASVFGVIYLLSAAYGLWWGGYSFPGRLLLPVLPLLSIPISHFLAGHRAAFLRASFLLLSALSIVIAGFSLFNPILLLNDADGSGKLWARVSPSGLDLNRVLPSFVRYSRTWYAVSLPSLLGEQVEDPKAPVGRARFSRADGAAGFLVYGPYIKLEKGRYQAIFSLKADPAGGDAVLARIDVSTTETGAPTREFAARELSSRDFSWFPAYQPFILEFWVPGNVPVEFRVVSFGKVDLWVDFITVIRLE